MKQIGFRGAVCGKEVKATIPDTSVHCPRDKVNQVFRAAEPALGERLYPCVYLAGARVCGYFYRHIRLRMVGWRVSRSVNTDIVLPSRQIALQSPAVQPRRKRTSRHSATYSIWSCEMKL